MAGFVRKALDRTWPAFVAFALVGPVFQAIETQSPAHLKGPSFIFPVVLLLPVAALFFGAAAPSDEREGGSLEFALSLPLTGSGLLARLFAAGLVPLALLAPRLWVESWAFGSARTTILEWGGPHELAMLLLWPYAAGFLASLMVDRFATALALAVVLFAGSELVTGVYAPGLAIRWSVLTLYALFVAQRLFAPPGILETSARAARAAAGLLGFGILALCLGRLFLFV